MRPKIFDVMDERGWVGYIHIEEVEGVYYAIVSYLDEREMMDWLNT